MKIQVGILFVMLMLFCGAFSHYDDDDNESSIQRSTGSDYEVVVQLQEGQMFQIWVGVILNDKFVLSTDAFEGKKKYDPKYLSIIVGYTHIGKMQEGPRNTNFDGKKGEYKVEQILLHQPLILLETKTEIKLNVHVRKINLPTTEFLESWKNPFAIPEKEEFNTTYWCRLDKELNYYLYTISKERKCSPTECYQKNAIIPGCIDIKTKNKHCVLAPGAPLMYDGMLVGLRKNKQNLKPFSKIKNDYFINIANYKEIIHDYMHVSDPVFPAPTP